MKTLILSLLLLLNCKSYAQSDYSKLDVNFGLGTNLYQRQFQPVWNLQAEYHLNARWSLLYNYNLGGLDASNLYVHAPMSLFAVGPVTRFLTQNTFTIGDFFGSLALASAMHLATEISAPQNNQWPTG
jgi:hypothetical protein